MQWCIRLKAKRYTCITSMLVFIVFALALFNLVTLYHIAFYQNFMRTYTTQYTTTQDVLPYEILSLNEQININRTGTCFFRISMTVNYTESISILQFPVDFKNIFGLETYLNADKANNTIETLQRGSIIKVYLPSERSKSNQGNLTILFFTTDLIYETTDHFEFEYFVTFVTDTYLFTLTVRLPEGGKLIDPVRGPSIFPYPTANWTDGTYFYFQWELLEIQPNTQMSFVIKYSLAQAESTASGTEPTHPVIGVAQLTGLLLGIGVSVVIVYMSFMVFSNARAIVTTPTWIDLPLKYAPFKYFKLIKKIV